jgi:hypothetical protein
MTFSVYINVTLLSSDNNHNNELLLFIIMQSVLCRWLSSALNSSAARNRTILILFLMCVIS